MHFRTLLETSFDAFRRWRCSVDADARAGTAVDESFDGCYSARLDGRDLAASIRRRRVVVDEAMVSNGTTPSHN